ncbi:MAG TPA: MFS transporter [Chloroflexota bacterium]|nr:MFS transporter [Chloroflexota bacterium]
MQRSTYSLVLPVYVPTVLLSIGTGILVPVLPLYADSFGVGLSLVSFAVAAIGFGTLVGNVPSGVVMERLGRKPVMVAGTVILALSSLLIVLLPNFWALVALRFAGGIASSMWNISRMAYLADVVPIADRGRAFSMFGGVSRIGVFIGPAVGGVIAQAFGLSAGFYLAAGTAALAALISAFFTHETRHVEAGVKRGMRWDVVGNVVRAHYRELATAGSAQIFAQMIRAGRQIIVPLYASRVLGLDVAQIGSIVSISSAVDMSLFLPAGFLMDRLGRKFASVPSFLVMALGMAIVPFTTSYLGMLVATCIIGFGNGIGSGTMMTLGADLAPREATGEFLGVWRLIGDVGSTGGPLVVGGLADTAALITASTATGLMVSSLTLAGVGVLAASTLLLFVRETLTPRVSTPP